MSDQIWTRYTVHRLQSGTSPEVRERLARAMWDGLCQAYPSLSFANPDSVQVADLPDGNSIRWAGNLSSGFFACEVIRLDAMERWQAFVVPTEDCPGRTGWRRWSIAQDHIAPSIWSKATDTCSLEGPRDEHSEPDFVSLLAAHSGASASIELVVTDLELRRDLAAESAHYRETSVRQAERLRNFKAVVRYSKPVEVDDKAATTPTKAPAWSDIEQWAEEHVDQVSIAPRAISEAKKALYEDTRRAFDALDLLASVYRPVKLNQLDRAELKARADALGLFIGGSIDQGRAGGFGANYFLHYGGRRRFLDQHIGHGSSRDPRFALRIYFTWCDDTQRVIVGWLPTHLPNSMT